MAAALAEQPGQSLDHRATQLTDSGMQRGIKPHGLSGGFQRRCFTSRHVPQVAEHLNSDLTDRAVSAVLPGAERQLQGLLRHLKQSSCQLDERKKQVMAMNCEALVPEDLDQILRAEFEQRCCIGERMNTELMTSARWVRLLQDCGVLYGLCGFSKDNPVGTVTSAVADMAFQKVLRDCDYGCKRIPYDLFCKALMLVAISAWPHLDDQSAFMEILGRIVAVTPKEPIRDVLADDIMLDANVVRTLDQFKPALQDLFHACCTRHLDNAMQARSGLGTIRARERTYQKYSSTQGMSKRSDLGHLLTGHSLSRRRSTSSFTGSCRTSDSTCETGSYKGLVVYSEHSDAEDQLSQLPSSKSNSHPTFCEVDEYQEHCEEVELSNDDTANSADVVCGDTLPAGSSLLIEQRSIAQQMDDKCPLPRSEPPSGIIENMHISFTNGHPVVDGRDRLMSVDQMLIMCKELGVVPDFLTRVEIVSIFKNAQYTGFSQGHGSSLYGLLTYEEFSDAVGQMAVTAYSKSPFAEEYFEAHEKVEAFLLRVLPADARALRERFLYGRLGRSNNDL